MSSGDTGSCQGADTSKRKEQPMILLGCLLAFGAAVAPRIILVLAWLFSDRWTLVWNGAFLAPLLGIILLPYTTIMFMLAVTVTPAGNSIEGFAWVWLILGLVLDVMKWGQMLANRQAGTEYGASIYKSQQ
jgi:hypothetical protein